MNGMSICTDRVSGVCLPHFWTELALLGLPTVAKENMPWEVQLISHNTSFLIMLLLLLSGDQSVT